MRGVRIGQVIRLASLRHASLPAELAGSITLAVADQVAANGVVVEPNALELFEDGTVRITSSCTQDLDAAAAALRSLLSRLLQAACSNTPSLTRVAQRDASVPVEVFIRQLEVALVPANRGAAKRALARLWREATRALDTVPGFDDSPDPGPGESKLPSSPKVLTEPVSQEPKAESAESPSSEVEPPRSGAASAQSIEIPDLELPKPEPVNGSSCASDLDFETTVTPRVEPGQFEPPELETAVEIEDCDVEFLCDLIEHSDSRPPCEALTAEPFPLVQLSRRTFHFDDVDVQPDTTAEVQTAVFEDELSEELETVSPKQLVTGDFPPYAIPTEPHRFSAPARFAKRRVSLAEYVSQLGLDAPADDWEIAEHIHRIANSG